MKNQRSVMAKARSSVTKRRALLAVALLTAASSASADTSLPAAATAAFTSLNSYVSEMLTSTWAIAVPMTLGFIGIKLFKKGANKAT